MAYFSYDGEDLKLLFNSCWNAAYDLSHRKDLTAEQKAYLEKATEQILEIRNFVYKHNLDSIWIDDAGE